MRRILFVDDEPKVLAWLERMLRSMRHEWEMEFAKSGPEALEALAARPFDVVVSDMRMPGMNGTQLLAEVMQRHPQVVRIILSGNADHETGMKSVGPAHQFLTKPCDVEVVKTTVGRACALRDLLADERLRLLVSQMQSLPSLPSLYEELVRELQLPNASLKRVGEIISKDVGMTAKILQMVNSAFFGLRREVSSIGRALTLLGLENVKRWSTLTVFAGVDEKPRELIVTALVRARFCELAGELFGEAGADQLFTLGLFSVVDALMDAPMDEVLRSIPFPADMTDALVKGTGSKGELLKAALACERARFPNPKLAQLHLDALGWATEAAEQLFGAPAMPAAA
jgi:CheY-like chemotaxis protein